MKLLIVVLLATASVWAQSGGGGCPCNNYDPAWFGKSTGVGCVDYDPFCVDQQPLQPNFFFTLWECHPYVGADMTITCEVDTCTDFPCRFPANAALSWNDIPMISRFPRMVRSPVRLQPRPIRAVAIKSRFWWRKSLKV